MDNKDSNFIVIENLSVSEEHVIEPAELPIDSLIIPVESYLPENVSAVDIQPGENALETNCLVSKDVTDVADTTNKVEELVIEEYEFPVPLATIDTYLYESEDSISTCTIDSEPSTSASSYTTGSSYSASNSSFSGSMIPNLRLKPRTITLSLDLQPSAQSDPEVDGIRRRERTPNGHYVTASSLSEQNDVTNSNRGDSNSTEGSLGTYDDCMDSLLSSAESSQRSSVDLELGKVKQQRKGRRFMSFASFFGIGKFWLRSSKVPIYFSSCYDRFS